MRELTRRQEQALSYIKKSISERGYPPTLREIGEYMGIRSTNGVNDHLMALEKKGYIARVAYGSRAIRLVGNSAPQKIVKYNSEFELYVCAVNVVSLFREHSSKCDCECCKAIRKLEMAVEIYRDKAES